MGALAVLEQRSVEVVPGGEASVSVRVRNTGTLVDEFAIGVLGDAAPWSTAEPVSVSLLPGAEETVRVRFQPPRSSRVHAGPMPFAVHVGSKVDPEGSVAEEGTLEIGPFSDTTAELAPRTSRGRRRGHHDLAIDNRGNVGLDATIEGLDAERKLRFEIAPPSIVADPGTAAFAKVAVRPAKSFWRGPPRTHQFRVQAGATGGTPVTADGTFLQEAILPSWFLRALLLLLALAVALLLLWFLLLRPTLEDLVAKTVEDKVGPAVQAEVAKALPSPPPVPPDGGTDGGGSSPEPSPVASPLGSSPSQSPGPAVSPPNGGPAGGVTSRDGRLLVGSDTRDSTGPAEGMTLFVTDLVFSNNEPDLTLAGVLQLLRDDEVLMQLRLADFRDLDFHFVTPIAIGDGEVLRLSCMRGTCEGAALYFSGYER